MMVAAVLGLVFLATIAVSNVIAALRVGSAAQLTTAVRTLEQRITAEGLATRVTMERAVAAAERSAESSERSAESSNNAAVAAGVAATYLRELRDAAREAAGKGGSGTRPKQPSLSEISGARESGPASGGGGRGGSR